MKMDLLIKAMLKHGASDLHIQAGSPPVMRIDGGLQQVESEAMTAEETEALIRSILDDAQRERVAAGETIDLSYAPGGEARFRVNVYHQRQTLGMVMRLLKMKVPGFAELNLPMVMSEIAEAERGLILVTGTTGSGKSTTLAAMIDYINTHHNVKIITLEDPIEYWHEPKKALVAQMEVGVDVPSFDAALPKILRQDPDVILVGELRNVETMKAALVAADTGHLVLSTIHTANASQTIERLISMFPRAEHDLLLQQLAMNLEAIVSMRLALKKQGQGRIPAVEVLRTIPVFRKVLHEGKLDLIARTIATRERGMQLFDQHLSDLYSKNLISGREALRLATNAEAVALAMRGITTRDTSSGLVR
jgi:twitching motility protein PilT